MMIKLLETVDYTVPFIIRSLLARANRLAQNKELRQQSETGSGLTPLVPDHNPTGSLFAG